METIREKLYKIVDSFLTEAKDQHGNERSLDQLNQDRHLAVDNLLELFQSYCKESEEGARENERDKLLILMDAAEKRGLTLHRFMVAFIKLYQLKKLDAELKRLRLEDKE